MPYFDLKCSRGHRFRAWAATKSSHVVCPHCRNGAEEYRATPPGPSPVSSMLDTPSGSPSYSFLESDPPSSPSSSSSSSSDTFSSGGGGDFGGGGSSGDF